MAIEFVKEDGTGLVNATSYADENDFIQYWENRGVDYSNPVTYPLDTIKTWLNRATQYIDFEYKFIGNRANDIQALEFPRSGLFDRANNTIASNIVPQDIINATCEMGRFSQKNSNLEVETNVKSKRIGPVSISYDSPSKTDKYKSVTKYLDIYLKASGFGVNRV